MEDIASRDRIRPAAARDAETVASTTNREVESCS